MPIYYGAKSAPRALYKPQEPSGTGENGVAARSLPEYLGLRFDQKTRALNACLFAAMALFSAGISLYAMARIFAAMHVFDRIAAAWHLPPTGVLLLAMALAAVLVLAYVLLGGLAGAMYNQALQFCLSVAGMLPVALLGLKKIGGWSGMKAAVPSGFLHEWSGVGHAGGLPMGIGAAVLVVGVGIVLGGGVWCADFRLLQTAMAARDVESARRAPLIAAAARVFVPLLLILPGLIAVGLPTPRTTIVIHNENGAIYHEITIVPPVEEAGQGLVPAKADAATGKPVMGADGHAVLDYEMATPTMLLHFLPMGMLGLGLAALMACLMSGVVACLTAFNTVFACDLYQAFLAKGASDKQILKVGRWAALGGMLLALGAACAAMRFGSFLDAMVLVFAVVNAPLFATLLLGVFWKRATGHGAFAGLISGVAGALLHHGLSLPKGAQPGIHGGWIAVFYHPRSELALGMGTAISAFCLSLLVTAVVSACTRARSEAELMGLVHSLAERPPAHATWWKRPEALAGAILLAAIAVNAIFI